jgi:hypothetical protein
MDELSAVQQAEMQKLNPQELLSWKAPLRPYKKRAKNVVRFYIALALLLSLVVFFFGDKILLLPIWAVIFLFYVFTVTPPPEVENKITKFGIQTAGVTFKWEILSHFYFTKRFGYEVLTIVTQPPYYMQTYLVIPNEEVKKRAVSLLSEHIVFEEHPMRTFTDRMVDLFSKLVPDDDEPFIKTSSFDQKPVPASP